MYQKITLFGVLLSVLLAMVMLIPDVKAKEIENLLINPDFDNRANPTQGWTIGAEGALSIDKKEESPTGHPVLLATINAAGAEDWVPEIHSPSFDVEIDKMYTIDFYAKTEQDATRPLGVKFEQLDTWVGPATTVTLTDEWQQVVYSPIMTMKSPPQVVIHIQFNKLLEDVWFSHFRVYQGKFVEDEGGPPPKAVKPLEKLATAWGKVKSR